MKVKNILISQPEPADLEKSPYSELIQSYKVNIDFKKFIKINGVSASDFRKDKVYIQDHSAVIFTSRQAIDHFFRIAKDMRVEVPESMKYFCISEATAFYLQKYIQYRKRKIFFGNQNFDDLIDIILKHKEENFLLPCSDIHKLKIINLLDKHGIKYSKAIIYQTVASDLSDVEIGNYDLIVFFSPAGVQSLVKNFPEFKQNSTLIGAFGQSTAKAVSENGLKLNIKAPTKTALSMISAIEEYFEKEKKNNKKH